MLALLAPRKWWRLIKILVQTNLLGLKNKISKIKKTHVVPYIFDILFATCMNSSYMLSLVSPPHACLVYLSNGSM
jgi:hypothetical protein